MAKGKKKNGGKVSDVNKIISEWEEKLSVAEINKNPVEAESIKRMLAFYKKKRDQM